MEMTTNRLENIELVSITIEENNPRKTFDNKALVELAISIKDKGVLQPILVRPNAEGFELVCGERRLRAAIMAGLENIPANIRELTDDEAFEMQITENLERKDVHPMEEAEAFKKMLDSGKYTIADIAGKLVKSETFIAQRIKLTNLIEDVKKDFYAEKLGIGHAMEIARLDTDHQKEIHEDANDEGGWNEGYGTIDKLKRDIEGELYQLDDAVFDTNSHYLFKEAGSCTNCPKRSGANPVLFPDIEEKDKCFDRSCFKTKTKNHIEKEVAEIINEGKDVVLIDGNYGDVDEFVKQLAKQFAVKILTESDYKRYDCGGLKKKGFYVSGHNMGKYGDIYLTSTAASKVDDVEVEDSIQNQIQKIETRAERSLELDGEKVWAKIREMDMQKFTDNGDSLSRSERLALFYAIKESCYKIHTCHSTNNWLNQMGIEKIYTEEIPKDILTRAMRILIADKLSGSYGSHISHEEHAALKGVLQEYYPDEINAFADEQQEIAEKRIMRTNERLEKLKNQLSDA